MVDLQNYSRRLSILLIFFVGFGAILVIKLFQLQIIQHDYYVSKALDKQQGYTELEPRRGEIYVTDYHSGSFSRVATNTTLDTIFADPSLIADPDFLTEKLVPILFDEEEAYREEELRLKDQRKTLAPELTEEEILDILKPRSIDELMQEFKKEIRDKLSQRVRQEIVLYSDPSNSIRESIRSLDLSGIEIEDKQILVYPPRISDPASYAEKMSKILDISYKRLINIFEGKNRYVVLATKLTPDKSDQIQELIKEDKDAYKGIGFEDRSYRFYPEGQLAAQVLGFVDSNGGQYGVESYFEDLLAGKSGIFKATLDGLGNQITVGDDTLIEPAIDGSNIYLTIDRSIQMEAERLLSESVINTRSDAGQLIVMNPKTGQILAMAHYPTFDPNKFWEALDTEEFFINDDPESEEYNADQIEEKQFGKIKEHYFVEDERTQLEFRIMPIVSEETGETYYEKFKNTVGSAVYRNRVIQDLYEPGSVFKAITMSAAIDSQSVTAKTTINDVAKIKVDEFTIDNALGKHYGLITMTQVLETSNNIGMAWVAQTIGRQLFYSYMEKYGLTRRTDIELPNESQGKIAPFNKWAESELVTHAFGQGISTTPIQMITALSVLANDGVMMQPTIIKKIEDPKGEVVENEPKVVRQVVTKKTADTLTAMLVSVVEKGQGKGARVPGYTIAGKTGTAQTYKHGQPLEGAGTTIVTFAGYAPANDPKFLVLVKLDRPRISPWADVTATPLFKKIAAYLLQYLNVAPDKI